MRSLKHQIGVIAATLTLSVLSAGCNLAKRRQDPPTAETSGATPAQPTPAQPTSADYFKDATSVPAKLKVRIGGPVRVIELVVYPGYVISEIQDPKKHENVDRYTLRDGVVDDGQPVKLMGRATTAKDMDETVVDLASVDLAAVPGMVKAATAQLKIDGGKVTHAILQRGRPFNNDVGWRVYVSGTRKDGSVEFDTAGHVKKVWN
jgi:hypothetical protein